MFCQNSSLCPIHLWWPCTVWFIASLSFASPLTMTRLWSMKGVFLTCTLIFLQQRETCNLFICSNLKFISEKAMAPHSSTLAWKIQWAEEPGRLQSMGSQRVGHDWAAWLSLFTFSHWRRKWQPTPMFLPGESQGQRSLVGCHLWGRTESDRTEVT